MCAQAPANQPPSHSGPPGHADSSAPGGGSPADPAHFERLFDRYWDAVFRYCYVRLSDWHLAEDTASQTFLHALAGFPSFRGGADEMAFRCWLFAIARTTVAGVHRGAYRQQSTALDQAAGLADPGFSLEELTIIAERQERLRGLLDALPPLQQEMIELRSAGLSAAEIGVVLGKSEAAVRQAQSRLIRSLRAEFTESDAYQDLRS
ncbi:MAG: sigma-70 family RNA polymerase sigma factor [Thermomicrobiales bacterium]|nr:sigma-70 family RNA polymerase sigma factor [Thermomicrobiales bacterium]